MKKGNTRSQAALDARRPSPGLSHAHASTNVHCTGDCHSIRMRQWRKRDTHLPSVPWTCALSLGRSHTPRFPGRAPCRWDGATHLPSLDARPVAGTEPPISLPWTRALSLGRIHPSRFPGRAPTGSRWDRRPSRRCQQCKHRSVRPPLHDRNTIVIRVETSNHCGTSENGKSTLTGTAALRRRLPLAAVRC